MINRSGKLESSNLRTSTLFYKVGLTPYLCRIPASKAGQSSITLTAASTASTALPPRINTSYPARAAEQTPSTLADDSLSGIAHAPPWMTTTGSFDWSDILILSPWIRCWLRKGNHSNSTVYCVIRMWSMQRYMISIKLHTYMAPIVYVHIVYLAAI